MDIWRTTKWKTDTVSVLAIWSSSTEYGRSNDTAIKAGTFVVGDDFEVHIPKSCIKNAGTCEM